MSEWIHRILGGLRALVRRRREDQDLDDELHQYFEAAVERKLAAGFARDEAIRTARAEIGSEAAVKDYVRDAGWEGWFTNAWQDVRYAARSLRASPGFTVAVVITLGLGIGVNTAMFSMLDAVMLRTLPVPDAHELVALYENAPQATPDSTGGTGRYLRFSYPRFVRLQQALGTTGTLAAMTRTNQLTGRVQGRDQPTPVNVQLVSGNYFEALRVTPGRGRMLAPEDTHPPAGTSVAVVSDGFWKRVMGNAADPLGKSLEISGVVTTVVGVAPAGFAGAWMDDDADVWMPLTLQAAIQYRGNYSTYGTVDQHQPWLAQDRIAWLNLVGRVSRSRRAQAETLLQNANRLGVAEFAAAAASDERERRSMLSQTLAIEPLAHGFSRLRARQSSVLIALMGLVGSILVLTSANVANLLLVRASRRSRETALRFALGATGSQIVRYLFSETLLLAMLGGLLGLLAAGWSRAALARQIVGSSRLLPPGFSLDSRTLIFAAVVSIATGMVFGLVPALRAARAGRLGAVGLNERHAVGFGSTRGMRPLVVLQLALSVVIIFAATLLGRTVMNLARVEPGFGVGHLVSVSFNMRMRARTNDQVTALTDRFVRAAAAVPVTTSAAVSVCGLLADCSYTTNVRIAGVGESVSVYQNWVGPQYLATIGLPLIKGREFDGHDTAQSAPVAIISDSIARRYFPGQDPIGRRLSGTAADDPVDAEIIGVARDLHPVSLREPPVQMVFYPLSRRRADAVPTALDLRVSGDPDQAVAAVREALRAVDPGLTVNVTSMPARLSQQMERERAVAYLTSAFAGLALLLASVGLYGLLSYGVAQRSREIGVRMALGAERSEILALVLKQGGVLAIVGLTLGLVSAPLATRSLQGLFFDVTPLDPPTFVGVTAILLTVAAVAAIVPARRATKVDPVVALRCE